MDKVTFKDFHGIENKIEDHHNKIDKKYLRVTPEMIESQIEQVIYFTGQDGIRGEGSVTRLPPDNNLDQMLFCVIILKNGWKEFGANVILSREGYDPKMAKVLAYKQAFDKLWGHFAFNLLENK